MTICYHSSWSILDEYRETYSWKTYMEILKLEKMIAKSACANKARGRDLEYTLYAEKYNNIKHFRLEGCLV